MAAIGDLLKHKTALVTHCKFLEVRKNQPPLRKSMIDLIHTGNWSSFASNTTHFK